MNWQVVSIVVQACANHVGGYSFDACSCWTTESFRSIISNSMNREAKTYVSTSISAVTTYIWLLTSMMAFMVYLRQKLASNSISLQKALTQSSFCRKSLITEIAAERLLPGMYSHMIPKCTIKVEFFTALGT